MPADDCGAIEKGKSEVSRKLSEEVSKFMARIGAKGGSAKGKRKARSPEHYAKMVRNRLAKKLDKRSV